MALLFAAFGCSNAQKAEPKTAHETANCSLVPKSTPERVGSLAGERSEGAFDWNLDDTLGSSEWSDATLDVIDLAPAPGTKLTSEAVLRVRLRYSIDRQPNARYALFAQFRMPGDTSMFEGSFNTTAPAVDQTADIVDLTVPLAHAMKDDRLIRPIQVKFVLTQYFSDAESVVIAETDYVELGAS